MSPAPLPPPSSWDLVAYLLLPAAITLLTGVTFYALSRVVRHLVAS